jgi:hypothetical protein
VQQKYAKRNWSEGAAHAFFLRIGTTASAPKGEGLTRFSENQPVGQISRDESRTGDV